MHKLVKISRVIRVDATDLLILDPLPNDLNIYVQIKPKAIKLKKLIFMRRTAG